MGRRSSWICSILINSPAKRRSAYIGEDSPLERLHRLDAAHLSGWLEKAEEYQVSRCGEESITFKAIAEAIGKKR